jgi:hypothetical protein
MYIKTLDYQIIKLNKYACIYIYIFFRYHILYYSFFFFNVINEIIQQNMYQALMKMNKQEDKQQHKIRNCKS